MPDTYIDGSFQSAEEVGPRIPEYPFRNNRDVTSYLFSVEMWQRDTYYVPQELATPHPTLTDFYLIDETDPARFGFGDLTKFRRTYSRIPAQQIEWSSMWVTIPKPSTGLGAKATIFGPPSSSNAYGGGLLASNWFFGGDSYYTPLKAVTSASFGSNVTTFIVPSHGFDNGASLVAVLGNTNTAYIAGVYLANGSWTHTNANAIAGPNGSNFGNVYQFIGQSNSGHAGGFQESGIFVRCRRVTDFYLPGVSAGISSPLDIVLPTDDGNSTSFIDKLLAGTGDITIQVGELTRWRNSPIYSITKTVIAVADLLS
jgi:hypothetical protein